MSGKLKEVKDRIASVKSTQQITKAMKLVAASKFKKATDKIVQMRPYSIKLGEMLGNIVTATEGDVKLELAEKRSVIDNMLLVVITSDKGLCGGFNANIIKRGKQVITDNQDLYNAGKISVMPIGKKAKDAFKKDTKLTMLDEHLNLFGDLSFDNSIEAIEFILDGYTNGQFDKVNVCYAQFVNAAVQNFKIVDFLPIPKIEGQATPGDDGKKSAKSDYIFEPDKFTLIKELAPKILKTQFYSYLLDSNASEHGARMTAMENASENANAMLKDLKIAYNKARQAAITTELTEIVSGAAALKGG